MSTGHSHLLYRHGDSPVHRLPAHPKLLAVVLFAVIVVATPREHVVAFGGYVALLAVVAAAANVPAGFLVRRMVVELPVAVFALLLPLVATGPRTDVLGVSLSVDGLWGGWNVLAKATVGVLAALLLAATTDAPDMVTGLRRLRVPAQLVEIAAFMVRYAGVVADDMRRMRIARESRAFRASHLGHARAVAQGAGALFVRTYERGERVHLAMLSRGYTGTLPVTDAAAPGAAWSRAAALPVAAAVVCATGWMLA